MKSFLVLTKSKLAYLGLILGVCTLLIVVMIALFVYKSSKSVCTNCNVILVSIDTLSGLHLPCYGYERNTAPNLCAFAKRNLLFTNSFSHSPTTLDSHFSIFTSLYPHTHKMTSISGPPLDEKYLTLTQVLRNNGYDTIYTGTLTDLHLPLDKGIERGFNTIRGKSNIDSWEESYKLFEENAKKNKKTFMFLHTYEVHVPYLTGHKKKHLYTDQKEYSNIPLTIDEYTKLPLEFLEFVVETSENFGKSKNKSPYKPYVETDLSIAEEMKKAKTYEEKGLLFGKLSIPYKNATLLLWHSRLVNRNDPKQVEYIEALYDEKINQVDEKLANLIKLVEDPKYNKNTILIITADHGEEFMEHGYLYHAQNLYTTSTLVPLVIRIPGVDPKKITELVQGIDIYPTVLSVLGLKPQSLIEGIDLTGIIKGKKDAVKNKYVLSEYRGKLGMQEKNLRFYYDIPSKKSLELYNLDIDPLEKDNVLSKNKAKEQEFKDIINKLNISFN